MAQNFSNLLNDFEVALLSVTSQKDSLNISFNDLKKMNRLKNLFSEMKFLTEIYTDWNVQSFRSRLVKQLKISSNYK